MGALEVQPTASESPSKPIAPFLSSRGASTARSETSPRIVAPAKPPLGRVLRRSRPAILLAGPRAQSAPHLAPLLALPNHVALVEELPAAGEPQRHLGAPLLKV
jgi:hypothetical protein